MNRRFRIVLTTNKRIVTEYVDVKTREEAIEAVEGLIEKHELGKLKVPAEVIEVDPVNNRRVKGTVSPSIVGR